MEIILNSIIAFASTNLDDIFLLILFFSDNKFKSRDIYLGQYLGIIALVVVSVVGSLVGNFIDSKYIGLLGLFPIYLGVRQITALIRRKDKEDTLPEQETLNSATGILSVATVTIANGGDNIGTYVPLFATLTSPDKSIMILVFLIMTFIWVAAAKYLSTHPMLAKVLADCGHIITPLLLCLLGFYILRESGSFELIPSLNVL